MTIKKIKRAIRNWWACRIHRCTYFTHYLAYGPAELTHVGFHAAERLGALHFAQCKYSGDVCPMCSSWEKRLRA